MRPNSWFRHAVWLSSVAAVLLSGAVLRAQDVFVFQAADDKDAETAESDGGYWIGLFCEPIGADLRSQLNLKEGQGLIVRDVADDSPAEKAGLKENDVLVAVGDKPFDGVQQFIKEVNSSQGKEMALAVYRGGKKTVVKVTPERRPAARRRLPGRRAPTDPWKWAEQMERGGGPFNMRFWGPGVIGPAGPKPSLPKDMTVIISRTGDQPAKITVKQGDHTWEATEKTLDKLPKQVRPHVQRLLHPNAAFVPEMDDAFGSDRRAPLPHFGRGEVEKLREEMNKKLEALRNAIEKSQAGDK